VIMMDINCMHMALMGKTACLKSAWSLHDSDICTRQVIVFLALKKYKTQYQEQIKKKKT
jgi:hypothetical protein